MSEPPTMVSVERLLAHAEWVRSLARRLLDDESLAEDVVQDTYVDVIEKPRAVRALRSWLGCVIRNRARSAARSRWRRARREALVARPEHVPSAEDVAQHEAARRRVIEAVMRLEEPFRSTILLRFWSGLEPTEIARQLQVPAATVRTRLHRSLRLLNAMLRDDRDDDGSSRHAILAMVEGSGWSSLPVVNSSLTGVFMEGS